MVRVVRVVSLGRDEVVGSRWPRGGGFVGRLTRRLTRVYLAECLSCDGNGDGDGDGRADDDEERGNDRQRHPPLVV